MENTQNNKVIIGLSLLAALMGLLLGILALYRLPKESLGAAPSGLMASVGTSSTIGVGSSTVVTIFETRNGCAARIITTRSQPINISVGSTSPTNNIGMYQAASTTVAYDGGLYGCDMWRIQAEQVKSNESTTTLTITETF